MSGWHVDMQDDFDTLNTNIWAANRYNADTDGDAPFNADEESAWFGPQAVTVEGGALIETVTPQPKSLEGRT